MNHRSGRITLLTPVSIVVVSLTLGNMLSHFMSVVTEEIGTV